MKQGSVKRSGQSCQCLRSLRLVGDKGYTGLRIRNYLGGVVLVLPYHDYRMNCIADPLAVKFTTNIISLNALSSDSNSLDALLPNMKNWQPIIQL
jgi:hypothetical protein